MSIAPSQLTIRALRCVAVEVPMTYALGTSQARITAAPLLLIDLETEEGVTGRSYLFCYLGAGARPRATMLDGAPTRVKGDRGAPADLWTKLAKRFMLIGMQGVVRMAMAGLDVAAWDALAIAAGTPLATYLGGKPGPIRAYNSCGLGLMTPAEGAEEAEKLLPNGFCRGKLRLGDPAPRGGLGAGRRRRRRH